MGRPCYMPRYITMTCDHGKVCVALMAADGMQPADRGQCWRELAAHHRQQQEQEARSVSGRLGSFLRVAGTPLWDVLVSAC